MLGAWPRRKVRAAFADKLERQVGAEPVDLGQIDPEDPMQRLTRRKGQSVRLLGPVPRCWNRCRGRRRRSLQLFKGCFDPNVAGGDLGLVGVIKFYGLQQCEDVLLTVIADQCLADRLLGCLDALDAQPGKHRRIALST